MEQGDLAKNPSVWRVVLVLLRSMVINAGSVILGPPLRRGFLVVSSWFSSFVSSWFPRCFFVVCSLLLRGFVVFSWSPRSVWSCFFVFLRFVGVPSLFLFASRFLRGFFVLVLFYLRGLALLLWTLCPLFGDFVTPGLCVRFSDCVSELGLGTL